MERPHYEKEHHRPVAVLDLLIAPAARKRNLRQTTYRLGGGWRGNLLSRGDSRGRRRCTAIDSISTQAEWRGASGWNSASPTLAGRNNQVPVRVIPQHLQFIAVGRRWQKHCVCRLRISRKVFTALPQLETQDRIVAPEKPEGSVSTGCHDSSQRHA